MCLWKDDKSLNRGISFKLNKEGYKVVSSNTIKGARQILSDNNIYLILLDVGLPDGNGFDFCSEIRKNSDILIIFLTACDDKKKEFLNTIKEEVLKLEWLTGSLIKLSRLEADMIKLKKEKKSIKDTIRKAIERVYSKALQKNIEISTENIHEIFIVHDNKIFKRFFRGNSKIVRECEGSGVGLYLTSKILETKSLKKHYGAEENVVRAVDDISFSVEEEI